MSKPPDRSNKGLATISSVLIGHLDVPIAGPPTGTTVMMIFAEKVEDANGKSGYGWRYAD